MNTFEKRMLDALNICENSEDEDILEVIEDYKDESV